MGGRSYNFDCTDLFNSSNRRFFLRCSLILTTLKNHRILHLAQKCKNIDQTLAMLYLTLGKLKVTTSTLAIWIRFRGVPKKFCSFQACRNYHHLSVGSSYFDLMTLPYRKFAAVIYLSYIYGSYFIWSIYSWYIHFCCLVRWCKLLDFVTFL